ncbi:RNA polymerase sigma factor [Paenibacillus sp. MSJ-34]|uniref:RNA polymerase sigma factor n=1 Tax=Paenibacillus sp. MSJ-34 TaxID=2841529 RepID=UPI0020A0FBB2|nr:sigma-70 family RNA polymerase sigma factor [Paenibacillus sp. MSJ-34]
MMREWSFLLYQDFDTLAPELQEVVYRSYYSMVYKDIFYLLGDHALTEDMIQEAFFKTITIVGNHKVSNMSAWMRQVARNLTYDYLKKTKKERYTVDIDTVINIENDVTLGMQQISVANEVEDKIRDELLHQAITELKPDYRILITLFYIEEKSYKEIAAELGLSEQAVSQKLMRARKKLLHQFQSKWVDFNGK